MPGAFLLDDAVADLIEPDFTDLDDRILVPVDGYRDVAVIEIVHGQSDRKSGGQPPAARSDNLL